RRRRQRIPEQLGVKMSMEVDETWRHCETIGIDYPLGLAADASGIHNAAIFHRHVAKIRRQSAAVINSAAFDQHVIAHEWPPSFAPLPSSLAGRMRQCQPTKSNQLTSLGRRVKKT